MYAKNYFVDKIKPKNNKICFLFSDSFHRAAVEENTSVTDHLVDYSSFSEVTEDQDEDSQPLIGDSI